MNLDNECSELMHNPSTEELTVWKEKLTSK